MRTPRPLPPHLTNGPFSVAEAHDLGVTDGRLRSAHLSRPFHGVRAVAPPRDTLGRCRAFRPRMTEGSFFNSVTAAKLRGLPLPWRLDNQETIHVAVPNPSRAVRARGVSGHKVVLMGDDWSDLLGLRVASPARAFCELAALLSLAELVAVGDHIIHWRFAQMNRMQLETVVASYPGQRGRSRLHAAVRILDDRAESPQESIARTILVSARMRGFVCNHPVTIGGHRVRIDIAFADLKVAIEYPGDYHRDAEQWRRDMTRRSILASDGWLVLEINADDLRRPVELVARVRRALETQRGVRISR